MGSRRTQTRIADARRVQGRKTEQIAALLGYRGRDELIHRDDLVLL